MPYSPEKRKAPKIKTHMLYNVRPQNVDIVPSSLVQSRTRAALQAKQALLHHMMREVPKSETNVPNIDRTYAAAPLSQQVL